MKNIMLLIGCLWMSFYINAQNSESKDPKAKTVLDQVAKKFRSSSTLYCNFTYQLENKDQGINETQKGTFKLKGTKYIILLEDYEIVSNSKTRWLYMKNVDEVQIEDATISAEAEELMNPSKIFALHEKGFKYKYIGKKNIDGKSCEMIKLFPEKASEKPYHSIVVYIDSNHMLYKAKISTKDGNKYNYTINKATRNIAIDDSSFTFDESKASEVIDLR